MTREYARAYPDARIVESGYIDPIYTKGGNLLVGGPWEKWDKLPDLTVRHHVMGDTVQVGQRYFVWDGEGWI